MGHIMKFLVLSALVAAASCQYAVPYSPSPLVAYTNGAVVPADTPAVAKAKADFAAAGGVVNTQVAYPGFWAYGGLVAHPNGAVVPAEPADLVAARAAHLQALAEAA